MGIKLQGLETDLNINTDNWNAGLKGALAGTATLLAGVAALGATVAKMVEGTFEWAGELDSIQDIMGGTTEEAAALNFILHKSGTETEKFTAGMIILEKGLVEVDGSLGAAGKKLSEFGISAFDANGQIKDQATLIKDISDKYNSFGTQQERVNFLTELFGKSGAGLIDVFDTLAAEGGLDKTIEKTKAFGLAIDPEKYEQFQRNLEEIKLAGLGMAVTFVDSLMPAVEGFSEWWQTDGMRTTQAMVSWLGTNIPIAVNNTQSTWRMLKDYLSSNVSPLFIELGRLGDNVSRVLGFMGVQVDGNKAKWSILTTILAPALHKLESVMNTINGLASAIENLNNWLEAGIGFWERFREIVSQFIMPDIPSLPNIPDNSGGNKGGGGGSGGGGGGGNKRRATGGAVLAGQSYQVLERGMNEVFTPNQNGRIDPQKPQTVEAKINEAVLGRLIATELAKVLG